MINSQNGIIIATGRDICINMRQAQIISRTEIARAQPDSPEGRIHSKSGSMESLIQLSGTTKRTEALKKYIERSMLSEEAMNPGEV